MDGEYSGANLSVYADRWQPGLRRVELVAHLDQDFGCAEAALGALGYEIRDTDQWGASYRHCRNDRIEAELDEVEDVEGPLRLVLGYAALSPDDVEPALEALRETYDRIRLAAVMGAPLPVEMTFDSPRDLAAYSYPAGAERPDGR